MKTSNIIPKRDFSVIFKEIDRYKTNGLMEEIQLIDSECISSNEEIRDFFEICRELNDNNNQVVYHTFS